MPRKRKRHPFQQDILGYFRKNHPQTAIWREAKSAMVPFHKSEYKDEQTFRTAFSYHIGILVRDELLKQVGDQYGLPNANFEAVTLSGSSKQKLKQQFIEALGDVTAERVEGDVYKAFRMLDGLLGLAPPEWRKPILPIWNKACKIYEEETRFSHRYLPGHMQKTDDFVRFFEQKFASVIYEN